MAKKLDPYSCPLYPANCSAGRPERQEVLSSPLDELLPDELKGQSLYRCTWCKCIYKRGTDYHTVLGKLVDDGPRFKFVRWKGAP